MYPVLDSIVNAPRRGSVRSVLSGGSIAGSQSRKLFILDSVAGVAIVLNTLILGVSADSSPDWAGWIFVDALFAAIFLVELCARFHLVGVRAFFLGSGRFANTAEFIIIVTSVVEVILKFVSRQDFRRKRAEQLMSMVKVARLFRVSRLSRLMQLEMFKDVKAPV